MQDILSGVAVQYFWKWEREGTISIVKIQDAIDSSEGMDSLSLDRCVPNVFSVPEKFLIVRCLRSAIPYGEMRNLIRKKNFSSLEIKSIGKSFTDGEKPFLPESLAIKPCFLYEASFVPSFKLRKCPSSLPSLRDVFTDSIAKAGSSESHSELDDFEVCDHCGELILMGDSSHAHHP